MAPNLQLHRFLPLNDGENTCVLSFLFEDPQDLYSIEVRSNFFRFNGIDWFVYTSRSSADFISIYLRAAQLDEGISCTVQYAFSIINMTNYKATVRHESPKEGRKFEAKVTSPFIEIQLKCKRVND